MTTRSSSARLPTRFWNLLAGGFAANVGDGIALVAFPWLASTMTDSPVLIGGVVVATKLPWLLFTLPGGLIIDRGDRRRVMIASNVLRFAVTALVTVLVATGDLGFPLLYLLLFVLGCAEVVYDSALITIVPAVVDEKSELHRANGLVHAAQNVGNDFVGGPIAGLLIGVALYLPFAAQSAAAAIGALALLFVPGAYRAGGSSRPAGKQTFADTRRELAEGFVWLWRHRLIRGVAVISGVMAATGGAALAVYVLFAREILGVGATAYALTLVVGGAGMIAGTQVVGRLVDRLGRALVLQLSLAGHGVIFVVGALSSNVVVVSAVLFLWGLFGALWNVITVSLRQVLIPDHLLGRVGSAYRLVGVGGPSAVGIAVGSVLVTVVAELSTRDAGLRTPFLLAGLASVAVTVLALHTLTERSIAAAEQTIEPT